MFYLRYILIPLGFVKDFKIEQASLAESPLNSIRDHKGGGAYLPPLKYFICYIIN